MHSSVELNKSSRNVPKVACFRVNFISPPSPSCSHVNKIATFFVSSGVFYLFFGGGGFPDSFSPIVSRFIPKFLSHFHLFFLKYNLIVILRARATCVVSRVRFFFFFFFFLILRVSFFREFVKCSTNFDLWPELIPFRYLRIWKAGTSKGFFFFSTLAISSRVANFPISGYRGISSGYQGKKLLISGRVSRTQFLKFWYRSGKIWGI